MAAVGDGPLEQEPAAGACVALGNDELRLIFAALLTTRNCEKDVGRCLCVCKEWSEVLVNTPSLWFKLFSMLDPTEAARAAAAAPAPALRALAKRGSGAEKDFRDNDFQRRFIEQYCWRKTTLCSRCFMPSTNAPILAWKVRLCSPCIAASILNKTDSSKTFMLTPADLAPLPTWVSGVPTPFGGLVKFYFRRHLERAAAQKHGADGVEAARQKQAERKEKRVQSRVDDKESKVAQVEEVLKDNGVGGGFRALHLLGSSLAAAVHRFVDPKAVGKKRRGGAAADSPLELTTIEHVSAAIRKELTRQKRRTALSEACELASFRVDRTLQPGAYAAYEAFVAEEDAKFDAVLKTAANEPAAKKRKTGGSTAKKGKRRARRSSDDEDSDDDAAEADDMELSEDEEAAIKPKPSRRRGGAAVAKDGGASAAEDLSAAALATVRDLMMRERRDAEAFAELRMQLNLGALDLKCRQVASESFFRFTPQYKALLEKLNAPLPAAASKRSSTAAGTATALGAAAAQDILSGIAERKEIINAATTSKLQELSAAGRSSAVIASLLECSAAEAAAVFHHIRVHDIQVINELMLHGSVTLPAPAAAPASKPRSIEELDDIMAMLVHHLHLKLRKGEMKERVTALFEALRPAGDPPAEGKESALAVAVRSLYESFSSTAAQHLYPRRLAVSPNATDTASLGLQLRDLLAESKLQKSTFGFALSPPGTWTDLTLVPASGDAVLVAQAPATPLGRCLEQIFTVLSTAEPAREFVRWVLDGRVDVAGGEPQAVDAAHIAARLSGAADARTELLAAVRALQGPTPAEPFTLSSAPSELLERIELFLTANQFHAALAGGLLTGEAAKKALMEWASSSLRAQERRFIKLEQAFDEAELDTSNLRSYVLSDPLDTVHSIEAATQRGFNTGLLFFLRGPKDAYHRRHLTAWRDDAIQTLLQKARSLKHEDETRGVRAAALARSSKMLTLRSMLESRVKAKARAHRDADWNFRDSYWAQEHAKEQSVVCRKFLDDTVNAAFPPAAASAEAAEAIEADKVDLKAIADAAEATSAFDAAVTDMVKLQKAAKGLSHSVLMATHLQQQMGDGRYGGGRFIGAWSDDDEY